MAVTEFLDLGNFPDIGEVSVDTSGIDNRSSADISKLGGDFNTPSGKKAKGGSDIGAYASAITTLLGVVGSATDIDNKNDVLMKNLQNQSEAFQVTQGSQQQAAKDLDRALGDKLSASGLEAMQTEARLKAGAAETGGTGTSNDEAVQTAQVNKLHRDAATMRTFDVAKANKFSEMVSSRLGFENATESLLSGQQTALSAGLSTAASALQGNNIGLAMMSDASKEDFFGTNTTGEKNG